MKNGLLQRILIFIVKKTYYFLLQNFLFSDILDIQVLTVKIMFLMFGQKWVNFLYFLARYFFQLSF